MLGGPEVVRCVFHSSSSTQTSMDLETCWSYRLDFLPDVAVETEVKHRNFLVKRVTPSVRSFVIATRHFPAAGTWHRRAVEGAGAKVAWRSSSAEYRG